MDFRSIIGSKPVVQLILFITRHMSRRAGYGLARIAADRLSRSRPEVYWTVWANLRQVVGPEVDEDRLHEMVHQVFLNTGKAYYDASHALGQPPDAIARQVLGLDRVGAQIDSEATKGRGVLLMGTHTSAFDLGMMALGTCGRPILGLSLANPQASDQLLNRLRTKGSIRITPITPESLRTAIQRLKEGGVVLTGADRPAPREQELVDFFGRPSWLPLGPARLALMTDAAAFVGGCRHEPDRGYILQFSGPLEMTHTGNRKQDMRVNARRIAAGLEDYVRANPEQWLMFHPIWPESPND